jgi:hypothetical protein
VIEIPLLFPNNHPFLHQNWKTSFVKEEEEEEEGVGPPGVNEVH